MKIYLRSQPVDLLDGYILQIDIMSGSYLLLDMNPCTLTNSFMAASRPADVEQCCNQQHFGMLWQCASWAMMNCRYIISWCLNEMREKENKKSWKIEKFYGEQYETFLCLLMLALAWQVLRCSFSICEKVEIMYYLSRIVAWARAGSRQIYRPDSDFCGWD